MVAFLCASTCIHRVQVPQSVVSHVVLQASGYKHVDHRPQLGPKYACRHMYPIDPYAKAKRMKANQAEEKQRLREGQGADPRKQHQERLHRSLCTRVNLSGGYKTGVLGREELGKENKKYLTWYSQYLVQNLQVICENNFTSPYLPNLQVHNKD